MKGLDADIVALLKRRVYDVAGTSNWGAKKGEGLKVYLNGKKLGVESFRDYVACFIDKTVAEPVCEVVNNRYAATQPLFSAVMEMGVCRIAADSFTLFVCVCACVFAIISWEVAVTASDGDGFAQVSFVNGIETCEGGTHVDAVYDQVVKAVIEAAQKKAKG
jgi:DNA topoisomerase-2